MNLHFEKKAVLITGAAGGLGSAMAEAFAKEGATVVACDLRGTEKTVALLKEQGFSAYGFNFDITDREAVKENMAKIASVCGGIDVLVNNAGINVGPDERKTVEDFSDKWWDAILKVDLDGTYNCTKLAIPYMKEGSAIVNISSIVGMVPLRNQCAFAAAKAAVINFTSAVAMEMAPRGIRANTLCPGTVGIAITNQLWQKNSAMEGLLSHIPMGRQGRPQEIANACLFLASNMASYVTGATLPVDGGWTAGGYARNF